MTTIPKKIDKIPTMLQQLGELETTIADATPEEMSGLYNKLQALSDGLYNGILVLLSSKVERAEVDALNEALLHVERGQSLKDYVTRIIDNYNLKQGNKS